MKDSLKGLLFKIAFGVAGVTVLFGFFDKSFFLSRIYFALLLVALVCLIGFFVIPAGKK